MQKVKFSLESSQLELLDAFERCHDLNSLAQELGRDPSVVSRNLQRMAEEFPVLVKMQRRWTLTPLGKKINFETRNFTQQMKEILAADRANSNKNDFAISDKTALVVVNAQKALHDPHFGKRNNSTAEKNIIVLLDIWRKSNRPIVHVPHVSLVRGSLFHRDQEGYQFISGIEPVADEIVIEKIKSSAFSQTDLDKYLEKLEINSLVIVGFTANECIDATARQASDLGYSAFVITDATAMFDMNGDDGRLIKAEKMHRMTMANLNSFFAKTISTEALVAIAKSE